MIDKSISSKVLTIGNRSDKPDGGMAQVLYTYRRHVFPQFNHVVNFKEGNFFYKMWVTICGFIQTFFVLLFNREIKIVHIHSSSGNGFRRNIPFVDLVHLMGKKAILHVHSGRFNDYYAQHKKQVEKCMAKCSAVVALTNEIKDFYEKMGCKKVTVINNIIEYPVLRDVKFEDNAIHYLYLGVITKNKGIYDLLDVVIEHKEELRGKFVLHVGGNREVETLLSILKEHNIEDIVRFEGWVSGDKKIDLLNKCDVFILPSYTEGLPISILEAQSYGMFTVATKVGGIPEIVNESNGMLFTPQDKGTLYQIIKTIEQDQSVLQRKETIKEGSYYYHPDYVSKQLEGLYSNLLRQ